MLLIILVQNFENKKISPVSDLAKLNSKREKPSNWNKVSRRMLKVYTIYL